MYFIAFLRDKDPGEFTGIESYISEKLDDKDLSWFPKFRSLSLKNLEDEGDGQQKEFISKCENDVKHIAIFSFLS